MKKQYLIFFNPASGQGKARAAVQAIQYILPFGGNTSVKIVESVYPGYVTKYIESHVCRNQLEGSETILSTDQTYFLVGIGGDGFLYEIVNAVQQCGNVNNNIVVGEIPCGSGNGFFKSITSERGIPCTLHSSLALLQTGAPHQCDLLYLKNRKKYLRLGVAWGLVSDLDLGTEWMRRLGSTRFTLGAIYYCLKKQAYTGTLSYRNETGQWVFHKRQEFYYFWATSVSHGSTDTMCSPGALSDDGFIHLSFVCGPVSRWELASVLLGLSTGEHVNLPCVQYVKTKEFILETDAGAVTVDGEDLSAPVGITDGSNLTHVVAQPGALSFLS